MKKSLKKLTALALAVLLIISATATFSATDDTTTENDEIQIEQISFNNPDFIKGMDVSSVMALEKSGVKYYNQLGEEADLFEILSESGVNYIRARVWNNPYDENDNGYGGGNNDVEKAAQIGARAAEYGMRLFVDFHYSDFWADPSKQIAPKEWANYSISEKAAAIKGFTTSALETIEEAGADIGMVQIGNETNGGIAGVSDFNDMPLLFNAGAQAVRNFDPDILVALHFTDVQNPENINWIAGQLDEKQVDYDVFAVSYYPYWHGGLENLSQVLDNIASTYNKYTLVAETSYAYTLADSDGHPNTVSEGYNDDGNDLKWAFTPQGQASEVHDVMEAVNNVSGGKGLGVFYWEGAWISVGDTTGLADDAYQQRVNQNKELWERDGSGWSSSYSANYANAELGGSAVDNQAFFDPSGKALPSLEVFKLVGDAADPDETDDTEDTEDTEDTDDTEDTEPTSSSETQETSEITEPSSSSETQETSEVTEPSSSSETQETSEVTEPSSSSETESTSETTEPPVVETRTIIYIDTIGWDNVYAYAYSGSASDEEMPGVKMTFEEYDENNHPVYSAEISKDAEYVLFNNGEGVQTQPAALSDEIKGFYLEDGELKAVTESSETTETTSEVTEPSSSSETQETSEVTEPSSSSETQETSEVTEPSSSSETQETSEVTEPSSSSETQPTSEVTEPTASSETQPTKPTEYHDPVLKTSNVTLKAGATARIVVLYSNNQEITYYCYNTNAVIVDNNGLVSALKTGQTKIVVKVGKKKLIYNVKVTNGPSIKIGSKDFKKSTEYNIQKGKTLTVNITGKAVAVNNVYKSSNKKVAVVDSAATASSVKIKGLKQGTATVTIKVNGVEFPIKVKVNAYIRYVLGGMEVGSVQADGSILYKVQKSAALNGRALSRLVEGNAKRKIVIPAKTVKIERVLHIGNNKTIIATGATILQVNKKIPIMLNDCKKTNYGSLKNFTVDGGIWQIQDNAKAKYVTSTFRFAHAQNITIKNARVDTNYICHAIELIACKNVTVYNCKLEAKGKQKNDKYAEPLQIDIATKQTAPAIASQGKKYVNGQICQNITVEKCTVKGSRGICTNKTDSEGGKWLSRHHVNVKIIGCTVTGMKTEALCLHNVMGVTVKDTKAYSKGGDSNYNNGCFFASFGNNGKTAKYSNVFSGNTFKGGKHGLYIQTYAGNKHGKTTITKNNLYAKAGKGAALSVANCKKVIKKGNKLYKW